MAVDRRGEKARQSGVVLPARQDSASDSWFLSILETCPAGAGVSRIEDGIVLYANSRCAELCGTTADKFIGFSTKNYWANIHEREAFVREFREKGSVPSRPVRVRRADGRKIWAYLSWDAISWNGEDAVLFWFSDISKIVEAERDLEQARRRLEERVVERTKQLECEIAERRQAEKALRRNEERFRDFTDIASDWLWEFDADLRFSYVSQNGYKIAMVTPEEVLGHRRKDFMIQPEDRERWAGHLADLKAHREFRDFRYTYLRRDGEKRFWSISGKPIFDEKGDFQGYRGIGRDITEQVAAEKAIAESEERFRKLIENAQDIITVLDKSGNILYESPSLETVMGYRPEELIGRNVFDLMAEDDARNLRKMFHDIENRYRKTSVVEARFRHKDGSWRYLEAVGHNLLDDPVIQGIVVNSRDVTDRKQAELALRKSEERYELAQKGSRDIIWDWDLKTDLFYMSENVATTPGLEDYHLNMTSVDVEGMIHPLDRPVMRKEIRDHFKGKTPHLQYEFRAAKQPERWFFVKGVALRDENGHAVRVAGSISDISDLKQAHLRLQESEAHWRSLTEGSPDIIMLLDLEARVEFVNRSRGNGENSGIIGRYICDLVPDEYRENARACINAVQETGQPTRFETPYVSRGEERFFDIRIAPAIREGVLTGYTVSATDITERKAIEQQLYHAQKMDAVGKLTGGIAHDFNNLLAVILGNLEIAAERADGNDAIKPLLERAIRAAERGAGLTQGLLAFSRKQALSPSRLNLNDNLEGMEGILRHTLGETIELFLRPANDLWVCEADAAQVESAILNLSINARDAMPGGGRLTIETGNVRFASRQDLPDSELKPGDYVVLTVSDTGSGMATDIIDRVFEPFFSTKKLGEGTGLGLSMVYGFAKQSSGHVSIDSSPGHGTTVRLYLPRAEGDVEKQPEERKSEDGTSHGEVIFLLEDNDEVRALVREQLEGLGYIVVEAGSGPEALTMLNDAPDIDLLLSDVILPGGLTGPEIATHVLERNPRMKALFMSGYTENAVLDDGRLGDQVLLLQKPFTQQELAQMVRKALQG